MARGGFPGSSGAPGDAGTSFKCRDASGGPPRAIKWGSTSVGWYRGNGQATQAICQRKAMWDKKAAAPKASLACLVGAARDTALPG